MGLSDFPATLSTKYGNETDPKPKNLYKQHMKKTQAVQSIKLWDIFSVTNDTPFLQAILNDIVNCKCCGKGLLEIKCIHSDKYRLETPHW